MTALDAIEAALLAPGAPFETVVEPVLGEPLRVFRERLPSLRALLARSAALGDAEYLVFDERRLTFAEHARAAAALAAALANRFGITQGDRVAILGASSPEWILAFWATTSLGAVAVALNAWWAGDEIARALADCQPKLLLGDARRLARLTDRTLRVPVLDLEREVAPLLRSHDGASLPTVPIDEDDPAVLLYTSGTSGEAKGAVHTHRNVLAVTTLQLFHGFRVHLAVGTAGGADAIEPVRHPAPHPVPTPCQLVSAPLFHVSGLYAGAVTNLAAGVRSVWTTGRFDAARVLEQIERERVTGWSPHGPMAQRVLAHPDLGRRDVSSLRVIGTGGAPFPAALQEDLRRAFPNARAALAVGYGLTEATALVTIEFGEALERDPDSVGRPLPTVEVEIRDETGRVRPEGDEGEICVRGATVMRDYWERPTDTARAIGPGRWLRTGDVGRLVGGRLHVSARRTDLILRGAENVYPAEIEARLASHPAVREAAVVGRAHAELGQEVEAIVVAKDGTTVTAEELTAWVAAALAYYKVPARWRLVATPLPRNAAGKVIRAALVEGAAPSSLVEE